MTDGEALSPNKCDLCVYNKSRSKGEASSGRCMPVFRTKKLVALQYCGFDAKKKRDIWKVVDAAWDVPRDCICLVREGPA